MIRLFLSVLKILLASLPFVFLCFASNKLNLSKTERSKQFFMPVIAISYAFDAMFFLDILNDLIFKLFDHFPGWFIWLAKLSWMPGFLSSAFTRIGHYFQKLFDKLNIEFWIFVVLNIIMIMVYLLVKKLSVKLISKYVKTDGELHSKIAKRFYDFFPERNSWCVKENLVQARGMFKLFYYSAVALSVMLMFVTRKLYFIGLLKSIFYPVFGIIVVGELYFYLDGVTKREYSKTILCEEEDAYRVVNYSLLRKFLRSLFGDKILAENTSINNDLNCDETTDTLIRKLERSADPKISNYAAYIENLNRSGFKFDHAYLHSSLDMLNGKSVLFNNPFYNDLLPYAFYPMNRTLLSGKKVLVVLGRHSIENDIKLWLENGIESITHIPFLWNIDILASEQKEADIGIMSRSDVLNIKLHNANADFFENVGFFVIIEPSKLVSTAQIGLNLLVKRCLADDENRIVYCLCDKNCDGLVDAMSHILMTNITEVSATEKHLGTCSYISWEVGEKYLHHRLLPNISRYLGFGTELSFAALKNQVSKTKWYGGEAFPVKDIHWIANQYYFELTKYANLPTSQQAMDDRFFTSPNYWSAQIEKNSYLTVEDESYNIFEVIRDFSTRTTEQGFVNIISTDYLLKDYMADNASIFETDAKAIPLIVADFARSNRNTALRLILMMSAFPVYSYVIEKELSIIGITVFDLKKQLWYELFNCYSEASTLSKLPTNYRDAVDSAFGETLVIGEHKWNNDIIICDKTFNIKSGKVENAFTIKDLDFLSVCISELRSASYVSEDEKGSRYYLGAELCGHIYQKYLPGQFLTFDGKYYEMMNLTADGQILLRRASEHITGRPTYRQIREYSIHHFKPSDQIGSQREISGMKIVRGFADVSVTTFGYYCMERYNDFSTARRVLFEGNSLNTLNRSYYNKEILYIELPEHDGKLNDNVVYTITLLLNEAFKTIFAENQVYICAVTDTSSVGCDSSFNPLTYSLTGVDYEIKKNAIYFIEDSQIDLGLIVTVERNLQRILNIIYDYIDWHLETLKCSLTQEDSNDSTALFVKNDDGDISDKDKDTGLLSDLTIRAKAFFGKLKSRKNKKQPFEEAENETLASFAEGEAKSDANGDCAEQIDKANAPHDNLLSDSFAEDKDSVTEGFSTIRKPYHERHYLLYGSKDGCPFIDLSGAKCYLLDFCENGNPLKQARQGKKIAELIEATYRPGKPDARYCDFCGAEIFGVEYETLSDGRDRCLNCGRTSVKSREDFRKIFEDVKRNMESFFGIRINVGIKVEMVNAKTLHKRLGKAFVPTTESDGRIFGVAIKEKGSYSLLLENGSPRVLTMLTIAHELTHIWQYINWDDKAITKKYGKKLRLQIYEGMAKWVEIQYAYLINEPVIAKREEIITTSRDDEYCRGFLRYRANYPLSLGTVITKRTPFLGGDTPLDAEYCAEFVADVNDKGCKENVLLGVPHASDLDAVPHSLLDADTVPVSRAFKLYAYSLLNSDEKRAYNRFYDAINSFESTIDRLEEKLTDLQVQKIIDYIQKDHPELIWFRHGATFYFDTDTHIVNKIMFEYCLTREDAEKRMAEIDVALKPFLSSVDSSLGEYDIALRVYENIIKLVDYDTIGLEHQNNDVPPADKTDDLRSIYGVFINKKAVCAGYAKAMQYLLNMFGVECVYVTNDEHAWNLVNLEGDYYFIDVTWGDGSDTKEAQKKLNAINYDCFCITSEENSRLKSHGLAPDFLLPNCVATKCNYHRRNGLYFKKYNFKQLHTLICTQLEKGVMCISFKFSSPEVLAQVKEDMIDGGKMSDVIHSVNSRNKVRIDSSYSYSVNEDAISLMIVFKRKM